MNYPAAKSGHPSTAVIHSPDGVKHPADATKTVWRRGLVVASALVIMVAACADPDSDTAPVENPQIVSIEPTPAPTDISPTLMADATPTRLPTPTPTLPPVAIPANAAVALTPVLEYPRPIVMALRQPADGGDPDIYIAGQLGPVARIAADGDAFVAEAPILDIADRLSTGSEQGLLGMAFSPDGTKLYLDYTDQAGATNVVEWSFGADGSLDMASERQIMKIAQPAANHNGGAIAFGPDGYLYIAMGDGGGGGDRYGNGQNPDTLLGSILRIVPHGAEPYAVPADNPFVDGGGRPEIWLYGLRNPWRVSFDRATGDLWIGDVGQAELEEINVVYAEDGLRAGANLGWPLVEGSQGYAASAPPDDDYVGPIHEYSHSQGCAVTGGYVYRGSALADFQGIYIFGDYCQGTIWGLVSSQDQGILGVVEMAAVAGRNLSSFGEGPDGELYVMSLNESEVYRLEPAP